MKSRHNFNFTTMNYFKSIFTLLALGVLFVSAYSQDVKGNGIVKTQDRNILPFSEIKASGILNVFLSQGSTESITIEADENLLDYIVTSNNGNVLVIKTKDDVNIKKFAKMNVYVTLKDISKLTAETIGGVECKTF